ncbi:hypothetical protein [Niabella beijingensis]|uniref:hypothetical protein n=1 Tax=Niabella beijingensis TaxID=2872700 RepID=UPI001CBB5EC6|nr:hypothetical protein [Niabella beijingensis]MBZ4192073.1 hypothetical protein [Niabella beijingensis]
MQQKLIFIAIMFLIFSFNLHAQKEATLCKGKGYCGYMFDTSYIVLKSIKEQQGRIILSCDDIHIAEGILREQLFGLNDSKENQSKGCPNINRKLSKYCRQYFGFINTKGEKIVWINMFWNKDLRGRAKYDLISVNDGCSYYWNVEVNITTKNLSNLQINGNG